jgi:hypothetical protein
MARTSQEFPGFVRKALRARSNRLEWPRKMPRKPAGTFSLFLEPFHYAFTERGWQLTTAHSTIHAKRDVGGIAIKQFLTPHLSKGEHLGSRSRTGPDEETFTPLFLEQQDPTKVEVIFGWTVDKSHTRELNVKRGIIVLVTKITVTDLAEGKKHQFRPGDNEILEAFVHEVAAHAGRISQGLAAEHPIRAVEDIAEEVAMFFRFSSKDMKVVPKQTARKIFPLLRE